MKRLIAILVFVLLPRPAAAQWTFEGFFGTAFSAPSTLTVSQTGYPDVSFTAHWETRPTASRQYYAWRLAKWNSDRGWIVEHVHHKAYLTNPTDIVTDFEVSHGYNLLTVDRGWKRGKYVLMFGGGAVVTWTHSEVRGKRYPHDSPYDLSGVTVQGGAGRQFDLSKHVFVTAEGKLTASWASVPIVDGHAKVPNFAFHVLAGAGWSF
jgi:hypothetical protein